VSARCDRHRHTATCINLRCEVEEEKRRAQRAETHDARAIDAIRKDAHILGATVDARDHRGDDRAPRTLRWVNLIYAKGETRCGYKFERLEHQESAQVEPGATAKTNLRHVNQADGARRWHGYQKSVLLLHASNGGRTETDARENTHAALIEALLQRSCFYWPKLKKNINHFFGVY
jgi:hypothetical protein